MPVSEHGQLTTSEGIHIDYQWSYTDAAARAGASGFVATDVGKKARQLDNNTLWMLTATTPTWVKTGGPDSAIDHGSISGLGDDDHTQYLLVDGSRAMTGSLNLGDFNITNVNNIALDSISSDAGTSINVTLGTDAGDDFNVGGGKLLVEGDTGNVGVNTATPSAAKFVVKGSGNPIQSWQNSSGTEIAKFDASGRLSIGGGDTGSGIPIAIKDNGVSALKFQINTTTAGFYGGIIVQGFDGASFDNVASILGFQNASGASGYIGIYTKPSGGSNTERVRIDTNGNVGIGATTASAKLHVDQSSATGAQPVLYLDQADVDQPIFQIETTIGTGNAVEAVGAKTLTTTHFVMLKLPGGLTRYFEVGTIA